MSSNNICNIDLNSCEKSKKYKRSDIDEIAKKCDINPKEYKNRKTLCEAIVNKKGNVKNPANEKPTNEIPKKTKNDCDIEQNTCEKSKKYNRENINEIAIKCGIENPKKFKNRKELCMAILEKRGIKTVEAPQKVQGVSPNCDKKTLEKCLLRDLQKIAKDENIKNYSGKKKDELIEYIKEIRKGRQNIKITSDSEDEEEPKVEEPKVEEPSESEDEIPIKPKKVSPEISKDCNKITLVNCKTKDLQIIAKDEKMKNYSKYNKKDELINFIKKTRKQRTVDIDEEPSEDEEEQKKIPLTDKLLKKIIKDILEDVGNYEEIIIKFNTFGVLKKYILEKAREGNYDFSNEKLKELDFKNTLKGIIADMREDYEDNQPLIPDKKRDDDEEENRRKMEDEKRKMEDENRRKMEDENRRKMEDENRRKMEEENRRKMEEENRRKMEEENRRKMEEENRINLQKQLDRDISNASSDSTFDSEIYNPFFRKDIVKYMYDLTTLPRETLIKIYKHIYDIPLNKYKNRDIPKNNKKLAEDICEYIQALSDSFFILYKELGDKRYQTIESTDLLAIEKYSKFTLENLIKFFENKYNKDVANNFKRNIVRIFMAPWDKDISEFTGKEREDKTEFPSGDIEDILDRIQKPNSCNPYNNEFCDDDNYCDISTIPGKCMNKNEANESSLKKINYNGYNVIGTQKAINKLLGKKNVRFDIEREDLYGPDSVGTHHEGDYVKIKDTNENGIVVKTGKRYTDNEDAILVKILPDGITKIYNYDEITMPLDTLDEEQEEPDQTEIIEDLEEKERIRIQKLKEAEADMIRLEEEENMRLQKIREDEANRLREMEKQEELKRLQEINRQKQIEQEEKIRERIKRIQEEKDRDIIYDDITEDIKDKVQFDNIDTLLSEIEKRSLDKVGDIDIVNNQVLKCLGLIA
jgi:hypothetical protein